MDIHSQLANRLTSIHQEENPILPGDTPYFYQRIDQAVMHRYVRQRNESHALIQIVFYPQVINDAVGVDRKYFN